MDFTPEEQEILRPFVSNVDKPVFVLTNLPDVVKGAVFSRYSRTDKSLRRVLLDEFINSQESGFSDIVGMQKEKGLSQLVAVKKAEEFYDRVLVGYGDDSVAELGGAHVACEEISMLAAKVIEDSRLGLSPLEKSTRYVYFDQKKNGRYSYYPEPDLMASEFAGLYTETCDLLFDTYARLMEPVKKFVTEKNPREEGVTERAYASTVKAKACDLLRGLLPMSALTNAGIFGNGRAFEYLLTKMYAQPLREMTDVADNMHAELSKVIPSFVKRAKNESGQKITNYLLESSKATSTLAKSPERETGAWVSLVDFDKDGEEKALAAMLYPHSTLPLANLREKVRLMSSEEKTVLVDAYFGKRENRRQKPGRALENSFYTFDFLADFGAYRDLQRHRVLTQERQDLTTFHGFSVPTELKDAGLDAPFTHAMKKADEAFRVIYAKMPKQAQYLVPLQYNIRWYFKLNAREVYHLTELRSARQGHPAYRKIAQEMYRLASRAHPLLFKHCKFVDMNDYALERLDAEKKIDRKMDEVNKKYAGG